MTDLTREEVDFLLTSLGFTRERFRQYDYPGGHEQRRNRIEECERVMEKIRAIRDTTNRGE